MHLIAFTAYKADDQLIFFGLLFGGTIVVVGLEVAEVVVFLLNVVEFSNIFVGVNSDISSNLNISVVIESSFPVAMLVAKPIGS